MPPNWKNQTLWTGDNLDIMRGMNANSADLIYLDPPFNSNRDYAAPIGSRAAGAAFKDTWTLSDIDLAWHGEVAESEPALYKVIDAAGMAHGKAMKSYLIMMAVRLLELRRILKDTGTIYLHCDDTANHYLKAVMDCLFGRANYRNEIIWKRTAGRSDARRFGRVHDALLVYSKSARYTWHTPYVAHNPDYVKRQYRYQDEIGYWRADRLTASGTSAGESGKPWRGIDPGLVGNHWRTPTKGGMNDFIIARELIPGWPDAYPGVHDRLEALDAAGLIYWPERGTKPALKRYLESTKGTAVEDIFSDIPPVQASAKENTHYPTQKPLALLERIINASSNPGDVVLDPFCGCATACVAAEKLGRQWAGIDISPNALVQVRQRLRNELGLFSLSVIHRTDLPRRTDLGKIPPYRTQKHTLFGQCEGICKCEIAFPFRNMTVDHIVPVVKGGTDHLENLQLLCNACNALKGSGTQEEFLAKLRERGLGGGGG